MNIIIPMNGNGLRFEKKYKRPKPLIKFLGKTLFEHAIETIGLDGKFIYIIKNYKDEKYNLLFQKLINRLDKYSETIICNFPTRGPVETCLLSENFINNDEELIIINCDQYLNWNPHNFLEYVRNLNLDCSVTTFQHSNIVLNEKSPYSFAKTNDDGFVTEMKEKFAISNHSLNGIHYWKKGSDFVVSAKKFIKDDIKNNGEFYISETFNYLIKDGKKIKLFPMEKNEFFSLGTPEDLRLNKSEIKKIING